MVAGLLWLFPFTATVRANRILLVLLPFRLKAGNKPYSWNVVPAHAALGVCLERMHRGFSELLVLAQRFNPVQTGPRRVSSYVVNHRTNGTTWLGSEERVRVHEPRCASYVCYKMYPQPGKRLTFHLLAEWYML